MIRIQKLETQHSLRILKFDNYSQDSWFKSRFLNNSSSVNDSQT